MAGRCLSEVLSEGMAIVNCYHFPAGVPSEYELGNFDQVKREIVDFCENEMEVHEEAKDTVVHDWLKGEKPRPRRRRSSSANANQRKPSNGTPVRNNMSLNY
jgi:hypothetical protein